MILKKRYDKAKRARNRFLKGDWSASALRNIYTCPLMFYITYFLDLKVPQNPYKVFGIAIHYFLARFYQVNYKSSKTYTSAWWGFWEDVVKGVHGPHGYADPPAEIKFNEKQTPEMFRFSGIKILNRFYQENLPYKSELTPQIEQNHPFQLGPYKITSAIIDRIQPTPTGGIEVWDYKPSTPDMRKLLLDIQFTIYSLAMDMQEKKPEAIKNYNYWTGEIVEIPPRQMEDYYMLMEIIVEATEYVRAVLLQDTMFPKVMYNFRYLSRPCDIELGLFNPSSPMCLSSFCEYREHCLQYTQKTRRLFPASHKRFVEMALAQARYLNSVKQEILDFGDLEVNPPPKKKRKKKKSQPSTETQEPKVEQISLFADSKS